MTNVMPYRCSTVSGSPMGSSRCSADLGKFLRIHMSGLNWAWSQSRPNATRSRTQRRRILLQGSLSGILHSSGPTGLVWS